MQLHMLINTLNFMKPHRLLTALCVLLLTNLYVAGKDFKGVVVDPYGAPLADAQLILDNIKVAVTDQTGAFQFSYQSLGKVKVSILLVGYHIEKYTLKPSTFRRCILYPLSEYIDNITVLGARNKRGNNQFSFNNTELQRIVTPIGEPDILRYIQVLPGVSSGMEGGLGLYVRGSGHGNNRVELDGVPVFAPTHLFGIFSTFHPDIVEKNTFQIGGIKAHSGDFLSSLLDVQTKDISVNGMRHGSFSISPLMAGMSLSGVLKRGKLSYQIAGRTTMLGIEKWLVDKMYSNKSDDDDEDADISANNFKIGVADVYAKVHYQINDANSVNAMGYISHDKLALNQDDDSDDSDVSAYDISIGWDNYLAKMGWKSEVNNHIHFEQTVYCSYFSNKSSHKYASEKEKNRDGLRFSSVHSDIGSHSRLTMDYDQWKLHAGMDYDWLYYRPVTEYMENVHDIQDHTKDYWNSSLAVYGDAQWEVKDKFKILAGVRWTGFNGEGYSTYNKVDLHTLVSYDICNNMGIEFTYDKMHQFHHTLEGLPVGWALNIMVPSTKDLPAEYSNQYYLGTYWNYKSWSASFGGYYKRMHNLVAYKSMQNIFAAANLDWQEDTETGQGKSYGFEAWIERRKGRFNGSLSYTWSKTDRTYRTINNGETFPFKFDRRHVLNGLLQCITVKKKQAFQQANVSLTFSSGNHITMPVSSYQGELLPYWGGRYTYIDQTTDEKYYGENQVIMSKKNAVKMPDYLRVDVGYSFFWQTKRHRHEITCMVYNVLNRHNSYTYFYDDGNWKQLSILPILPSIRWKMSF